MKKQKFFLILICCLCFSTAAQTMHGEKRKAEDDINPEPMKRAKHLKALNIHPAPQEKPFKIEIIKEDEREQRVFEFSIHDLDIWPEEWNINKTTPCDFIPVPYDNFDNGKTIVHLMKIDGGKREGVAKYCRGNKNLKEYQASMRSYPFVKDSGKHLMAEPLGGFYVYKEYEGFVSIFECAPGNTINNILNKTHKIDDEKAKKTIRKVADALVNLHAIPASTSLKEEAISAAITAQKIYQQKLRDFFTDDTLSNLLPESIPDLEKEEFKAYVKKLIEDSEKKTENALRKKTLLLTTTHGDAHGGNIFFLSSEWPSCLHWIIEIINKTPCERVTFIDFGTTDFSDPTKDAGRFIGSLWSWAAGTKDDVDTDVDTLFKKVFDLQNIFVKHYIKYLSTNFSSKKEPDIDEQIFKVHMEIYKYCYFRKVLSSNTRTEPFKKKLMKLLVKDALEQTKVVSTGNVSINEENTDPMVVDNPPTNIIQMHPQPTEPQQLAVRSNFPFLSIISFIGARIELFIEEACYFLINGSHKSKTQ